MFLFLNFLKIGVNYQRYINEMNHMSWEQFFFLRENQTSSSAIRNFFLLVFLSDFVWWGPQHSRWSFNKKKKKRARGMLQVVRWRSMDNTNVRCIYMYIDHNHNNNNHNNNNNTTTTYYYITFLWLYKVLGLFHLSFSCCVTTCFAQTRISIFFFFFLNKNSSTGHITRCWRYNSIARRQKITFSI